MADEKFSKGAYGGEMPDLNATLWSRRDIFSLAGWAGFAGVVGASLLAFTRFMFPRVLFEPSPVFAADKPENFVPGVVDERWKKGERVWIVRKEDGSFYALLAICTHLGCTPNWFAAENKFKCPCHGSGFKRDGTNFEGPAPRPLDRIKIAMTPEGLLQVDKSAIFRMAPGSPEVQYPQSILKV
ncbi:MAG: ubiquinol-cytochrome c reductase iron-sulfur subunit [candidate division NC10 bacterium]|nr:ubiquinol-cytochrome c reductase iron-sulfur subunit [candidate division NC10 bacterium]